MISLTFQELTPLIKIEKEIPELANFSFLRFQFHLKLVKVNVYVICCEFCEKQNLFDFDRQVIQFITNYNYSFID